MKNKFFNWFIIGTMFFLMLEFLLEKKIVFETVRYSLDVWVRNLLPSLFPFFVVSDILVQYDVVYYIPRWLKKGFSYLFGVSENIITIFFISCLSGFPSNARITRMMYDRNDINAIEASKVLVFTHFSNPIFVLSVVGGMFLRCEKYGFIILVSHYLGNIILGIINRDYYNCNDYTKKVTKSQSFSQVLVSAIRSSLDSCLFIFGTLTCFLIFAAVVVNNIHLSVYSEMIFRGLLEITMGLKNMAILHIPDIYKLVIATVFLSFGGLSVHLQVISQLVDTDISYKPFFMGRIVHSFISGLLCFIFYQIFF